MLKGIQFARERDWPFLGTCGGFQYALIECVRNVLNIKDADSAENNSGSKNIVICPVACAVPNQASGAPKLSGVVPEIRLRPGSYLQSFYGKDTVSEEFFCNFEVNPDFEWAAIEAGFPVVARGPQGRFAPSNRPTHVFLSPRCINPSFPRSRTRPILWCWRSCRRPRTGEKRSSMTPCWNRLSLSAFSLHLRRIYRLRSPGDL